MSSGVPKALVGIRVIVDNQDGETFNVDKVLDHPLLIGRDSSCDVVLPSTMVSRHHATLEIQNDKLMFTDSSANGSLLDGALLKQNSARMTPSKKIQIGPFSLRILLRVQPQNTPQPRGKTNKPRSQTLQKTPISPKDITEDHPTPQANQGTSDVSASIRREIHRLLVDNLDLAKLERSRMNPHMLRAKVKVGLEGIVENVKTRLPQDVNIERLLKELTDEALGLGPLEDLIADPCVSEIMVVDPSTIYIERDGKIQLSTYRFTDDQSVRSCIERIVTPLGRRIDESSPMLDARLPDGSRVNAVIRPLAIKGTCITIRKFATTPLTMNNLVEFNTLNKRMALFLERAVKARKNILISGGTGSGKTTLLNILSASIPETERIVTIEDSAELNLAQTHVVSLECRPANMEGKGEVTIRDLVKNAMRMRPDRVIVGEVRGGEALDMLQAMNTGHDGSMATTHANNPEEAVKRIETLTLMAGLDLPSRSIREQLGNAVHLIVQQHRFPDGTRKITSIAEVAGMDPKGNVRVLELFGFKRTGMDSKKRIVGNFYSSGTLPTFIGDFVQMGLIKDGEAFL